ncbi:uncharacterized protein ARB_03184 [Trichophyton benhamiae CBS 112371]|uniref:Uncharacterized protein n=1 Tax=Arthroderma benhamiae (strain ATCC MYA-4681 / CBS 112371) TaxID=663331 RepID=D4B3Z5_ARTBC|nr:uncharacterized protein ARB_03184 [Trichophyton benhamiae CBS 112371]EFE29843.1 hypothetical protein ARB_03184 [Trichophyton benhamiae CBS 112371]
MYIGLFATFPKTKKKKKNAVKKERKKEEKKKRKKQTKGEEEARTPGEQQRGNAARQLGKADGSRPEGNVTPK